ncbi:DoxX family protein [Flavobacterium ustbae]|uniref:DoxX family protein n=1 Tax=Flavobacterium ustbae TaxID=2488790 RepID=UPI000F7B77C0|nr:DoxX family protein [Flavobacterium ustbae]
MIFEKIIQTDGPKTTLLIRFMIGIVFLSEGIQKYLFSFLLGAERLQKISLPESELLGIFEGWFEIFCGISYSDRIHCKTNKHSSCSHNDYRHLRCQMQNIY